MDNELIRSAQSGDAEAFERLLHECYDTMYRFAFKWCGNEVDAQDITQQSCVKLARTVQQFRFESAFSSWLYRLVINCAKDWQKSHSKYVPVEGNEISEVESANVSVNAGSNEQSVFLSQVLARVETLGEGFKETLLLVFAEGCTHGEAASILSVKEGTISWRIHEIRKTLGLWNAGEEGAK